jgi:hypothetical protein
MYLSKEDKKEKKNRKKPKVKNPPTRRQLNRRNTKSELKAEKLAAKTALCEESKVSAKKADQLYIRKARGRALAKFARAELNMSVWQWH